MRRAGPIALMALLAACLAAGSAARLPLSVALALSGARGAGLDWRAAEGTVWNGQVRGLALRDYLLGDVRVSLSPFSLLTLSPRAALRLDGPEAEAEAQVALRPGGALRVSNGAARLRLAEIVAIDPRLRARGGTLTAEQASFALRDGRCVEASGQLASDALTYGLGGDWRGPALTGGFACEAGVVVAHLSGAEEGQEVETAAHLGGGDYRVEAVVRSSDPDMARIAPLIGFSEYGEGWRYQRSFAP